jgi:prophage DNA circulation protein
MSRVDNIYQGSWNGVEFLCLDAGWSFGQRGQLHEYPDRDKGYFEPLGARTDQYTLDIFLVGDDWVQQRQDLVTAFKANNGAGRSCQANVNLPLVSAVWRGAGELSVAANFV